MRFSALSISALRRPAIIGLFVLARLEADAQLAAHSPFLPPQGAAPVAQAQNAPLEYRGFIETGEGVQYRIHDPAKKAGTWAKVNEREANFGVLIKQYDAERKVLTVEHEGRTLTLPERESKVVSSGSAAQVMPQAMPMPAPNVAPGVAQSVVVNPTPADEQRRLEAVAAEVARRRALREQASQQLNPNNPPQQMNGSVTVPGIPRPMPPVQRR